MVRLLLLILLQAVTALAVAQVPANDECANAIPLTVSSSSTCTNSIAGTSLEATQSMPPCSAAAAQDVWFRFTATHTAHAILLTRFGISNPIIEVFSGSCGSLTSIICQAAPPNEVQTRIAPGGLTIGNTYYIRVYANYVNGGTFTLCVFPPGANDECTGTINIPLNTGLNWTSYTTGNNSDNAASGSGCVTINRADGWFSFIAQDTVQLIHMTGNATLQVYEGNCGSLSLIQGMRYDGALMSCFGPGGSDGYYTLRGLTIGNTYYINAMSDMNAANSANSFNLAIGNVPANDGFTGAQEVTVNTGTDCISRITGNLRNASPTLGVTHNCGQFYSNSGPDLWYKFTATASRHLIAVNFYNDLQNPGYQVYYMDNGNLQPVTCGEGNEPNYFNDLDALTPGTVYYVRVKAGINYMTDELFNLCITTPSAIPANDDCAAAQTIPFDRPILASTTGATFTTGLFTACGSTGAARRDLYYTFTPPATASAILQFVIPGTASAGIELYTGTCGSLTQIDCINMGPSQTVGSLAFQANGGTVYYVRMYGSSGFADIPFMLSFSQFSGLPVNITSFKAERTPRQTVKLIWKTEEESNINYYHIERSKNGILFSPVTRIVSRNSSTPTEYSGEDLDPPSGLTYYRLKIVDMDGKVEYSKTVTIRTDNSINGNLQVIRRGNLIAINNQHASIINATVNIYTASGQRIYSANKRLNTGVNEIAVPQIKSQVLLIQVISEDNQTRTFKLY